MTIDRYLKIIDGEPYFSPLALSLLLGKTEKQLTSLSTTPSPDGQGTVVNVPKLWMQEGRRRVKEVSAAIGTSDVFAVLEHLEREAGR